MRKAIPAARVSQQAAARLAQYLRDLCQEIAIQSWALAQHGKRTTITSDDVGLAISQRRLKE
jgi:histone H3/H4